MTGGHGPIDVVAIKQLYASHYFQTALIFLYSAHPGQRLLFDYCQRIGTGGVNRTKGNPYPKSRHRQDTIIAREFLTDG
jgi:hypothetical protein